MKLWNKKDKELYRVYFKKNGCSMLGSKFIKSSKFIPKIVQNRKMKSYTIEKDITLIGAPLEFIQSEHLPPYELIKRKAKKK